MVLKIKLSPERRKDLIAEIQAYLLENHDEDVGDLKAGFLLDFFVAKLGPSVYNQAIRDAHAFLQARLEDLDGEFYEPEEPPRTGE